MKDYSYEGGVLLGLGLRFLIDAGTDDADIFAAVAAILNAARNPDDLSSEVKERFTASAAELGKEVQGKVVR